MQMCDLHVHSVFSDGTDTPQALIRLAQEAHLGALALCDHNTVAGLPDFIRAAENSTVEAVPGVEFSTDYGERELHILTLFVEAAHYAQITALLERGEREKEQSNIDLVAALNRAGYPLDYAAIKAKTPRGHINRAHIAAEMTARGYVPSVQAAFQTLLSPKHGLYHPPKRIGAYEAIRFIKSIGAVAVLAHPLLSMDEPMLRAFLPEAVRCGLDGMEVYYSKYDAATTALAVQIAREHGLLPSGGSDYHGENKPDIAIGVGRGGLHIPLEWMISLQSRKK